MPINQRNKILYVHIPKTSGSYVEKLMDLHDRILFGLFSKKFGRTIQHLPFKEIKQILEMNNINIKEYYIFTTVRNPYHRYISAYNQYPYNCNGEFADMIGGRSLKNFAKYLYDRIKKEGYNFMNYGAFHQFQPSHFYLEGCNGSNIDIIKMDSDDYNNKIKIICSLWGINYSNFYERRGIVHSSKYNDLLDDELKEYLKYIYQKDFEMFEYST